MRESIGSSKVAEKGRARESRREKRRWRSVRHIERVLESHDMSEERAREDRSRLTFCDQRIKSKLHSMSNMDQRVDRSTHAPTQPFISRHSFKVIESTDLINISPSPPIKYFSMTGTTQLFLPAYIPTGVALISR